MSRHPALGRREHRVRECGQHDAGTHRPRRGAGTSAPAGRIDHIKLHVPSTDAAHAELVAKGVTFRDAPRDFKNVRIAFFFDPDGNVLELVEEKDG
ncbi:MAG: VOC family protein [Caldilineaceae bacterium]